MSNYMHLNFLTYVFLPYQVYETEKEKLQVIEDH